MRKRFLSVILCLCMVVGMLPAMTPAARASTNGITRDEAVRWVQNKVTIGAGARTECVVLIYEYYEYLGYARPGGNATDFMEKTLPDSSWRRYYNSETPQPGDIVVWKAGYTNYNGWTYDEHGHVGIITAVNESEYTFIDYNGDGTWGSPAKVRHKSLHDFSCVIRPDWASSQPTAPIQNLGSDFYAYINHPHSGHNLENANSNVQLAVKSANDPKQIWHFLRQSDQSYKIVNLYDGRCMDVANAQTAWGTNIQVVASGGAPNDAQRWSICGETQGGMYYLTPGLSKDHALVLDVANGGDAVIPPGRNICLNKSWYGTYPDTFNAAQAYQIQKISNIEDVLTQHANSTLGSDFYARISYNGSYLETTGDITQSGQNMDAVTCKTLKPNDEKQIWHFIRQTNGSYKIVNEHAGWCLDVADASLEDGTKVRTWFLDNGSLAQRWYLMKSPGDSVYRIASAQEFPHSIHSLDIPVSTSGEAAPDGTRPTIFHQHQNANQQFTITKVDPPTRTRTVTVSAGEGGTVTGGRTYSEGTSVTVRATASSGYRFVEWQEDGRQVSASASYTFTLTKDRNLRAMFEKIDPAGSETYAITTIAGEGGTITSANFSHCTPGSSVKVSAAAYAGYRFVEWREDGRQVSTSASYSFIVTRDRTLTAVFEKFEPASAYYIADGYAEKSGTASFVQLHLWSRYPSVLLGAAYSESGQLLGVAAMTLSEKATAVRLIFNPLPAGAAYVKAVLVDGASWRPLCVSRTISCDW